MKSLITYYSYSGNTNKVAQTIARVLNKNTEVDMQRLMPKEEIKTFLAQCRAAFRHKRIDLEGGVIFNVSPYDYILIGSPVWAFAPTPAINTYLDNITGLAGKRVIFFLTSGSGAGVKRCFNIIKSALKEKGASRIDGINIQDKRLDDEEFIISTVEKLL